MVVGSEVTKMFVATSVDFPASLFFSCVNFPELFSFHLYSFHNIVFTTSKPSSRDLSCKNQLFIKSESFEFDCKTQIRKRKFNTWIHLLRFILAHQIWGNVLIPFFDGKIEIMKYNSMYQGRIWREGLDWNIEMISFCIMYIQFGIFRYFTTSWISILLITEFEDKLDEL